MNKNNNSSRTRTITAIAGPLAVLMTMAGALPAYAAVTNTVTVRGTAPSGVPDAITDSATEEVDVVDDAPALEVVRNWNFAPGPSGDVNGNGLVDAGDQIIYTYAVHNNGNVTLANVSVNDVHDGTGLALAFVTPAAVTTDNGAAPAGTLNDSTDVGATLDGDWDLLGPDDFITFTSQPYTVTPGDLVAATSSDGDIDGTVTASGSFGAAPVTGTGSFPVPLNQVPSLEVSKVASQDTNVPAGTVITYTYRVKNNGTVPITNVTLSDTHKGVPGALTPTFDSWVTNTGSTINVNTIDTLAPGDEAQFIATYTVTQSDVDTLQ